MTRYVAFLRGIGGTDTKIKMQVLKEAFEEMGFQKVKTVIASGNVIFDAKHASEKTLERTIEKALPNAIGFGSATFVYKFADLQRLARSSLAKKMKPTPKTRPLVAFLKEPVKTGRTFDGKGFRILGTQGRAVFTLFDASGTATHDLMLRLEKDFGEMMTTRSWMTIEKILAKKV